MIGFDTLHFFLNDSLGHSEFEVKINQEYEFNIPSIQQHLHLQYPDQSHKYELCSINFKKTKKTIEIIFDKGDYDFIDREYQM